MPNCHWDHWLKLPREGTAGTPSPLSLVKGAPFSFYKRHGAWAGLRVSSAGRGGQCCAPPREQSGRGSWLASWEVKPSLPVQTGLCKLVRAWNASRKAGIYFPRDVGLQIGGGGVCQPCVPCFRLALGMRALGMPGYTGCCQWRGPLVQSWVSLWSEEGGWVRPRGPD